MSINTGMDLSNIDNTNTDPVMDLIKDLQEKYGALEARCKYLEEQVRNNSSKNKKTRLEEDDKCEYAAKNVNYSTFLDELKIDDDHLRIYFDHSYEDAFIQTIERVISFTDASDIPLHRTEAKKLIYYENGKWEQWNKTQIENFVFKVHHKVMHHVLMWQQEHSSELEFKESLQQWFHELLKKLTNRRAFSIDKVKRRLLSILNFDNNIDD